MAQMKRRRPSSQQEVRLVETVVVPRYAAHFLRPLLDELPPNGRTILDVGCGTGHSSRKLLQCGAAGCRVIAIDEDPGLIDVARRRTWTEIGKRLFFKVESVESLSFGDDVFDAVVGNLVYETFDQPLKALGELRRVLTPGGRLLLTTPLRGTFGEVFDMLHERAVARNDDDLRARVEAEVARDPTPEEFRDTVRAAGFRETRVLQETFRLSFRDVGELFADHLITSVALPRWQQACGEGSEELLREAQRALEIYFAGAPLSLTVHAGALVAR